MEGLQVINFGSKQRAGMFLGSEEGAGCNIGIMTNRSLGFFREMVWLKAPVFVLEVYSRGCRNLKYRVIGG